MEPSHAHKKAAREFYEALKILIPCPICKDHYIQHLEKYPLTPYLDRRTDLLRWTILLHNQVNKTLNKREYTESEVIEYYRRLGERGKSPVIKMDDFIAADTRSFIQGLGIGLASATALAGILFVLDKS